ncbi:hypothetical protein D3C71_1865290 [compost metagenome]
MLLYLMCSCTRFSVYFLGRQVDWHLIRSIILEMVGFVRLLKWDKRLKWISTGMRIQVGLNYLRTIPWDGIGESFKLI